MKNKKNIYYKVFIIMLIIALANNGFTLIPGFGVRDSLNVIDLGLLLSVILVIYLLIFRQTNILKNPISLLVLIYLICVFIKVIMASFVYGQSLINGIIAVRQQYYYLTFFVFLILLNDINSIHKLQNMLLLMSFTVGVLSIINYFYPVVFVDKWEHDSERSGIKRGYVPGMWLMSFSFIWCAVQWAFKLKGRKINGFLLIFYFLIHLFRQTRSLIFSSSLVFLYILFVKRKFSLIVSAGVFSFLMVSVSDLYLETNILINSFETAVEDVSKSSGTWDARVQQADFALSTFIENPIFGSNATGMRMRYDEARTRQEKKWALVTYNADLGYMSFLKSYGLFGAAWLLLFIYTVWVRINKSIKFSLKGSEVERISYFSLSYLYFVIISFITINHFMYPSGIVLLSLIAAFTVRIDSILKNRQ